MNNYKLLTMTNGMARTIYITATDITQAAYSSGVNSMEIVRIELIDSVEAFDFRTPSET